VVLLGEDFGKIFKLFVEARAVGEPEKNETTTTITTKTKQKQKTNKHFFSIL